MSEKLYREFDQCPICGDLLKKGKVKGNLICSCCGFVAPTNEVTSLDLARLSVASDALRSYEFSKAFDTYQLILEDNRALNNEIYVASLWGKLLATFGVIYIKDMNGEFLPTFSEYDPEYKSILDSEEYKELQSAKVSGSIKDSYIEKAKALDVVYKTIDKELKAKKDYDVFICTKISRKTPLHPDYDGYTEDSKIADDFYDALTEKGLRVFYSEKCCQGIDYDSQILSALLKSDKILIIATEKDYLESPWVQSEWRRWVNFINCGAKSKDSIILYFPHFEKDPFGVPRELKKVQRYSRSIPVINLLTENTKKALQEKKEQEERQKALELEREKEQLRIAKEKRLEEERRKKAEKKKAEEEKKLQKIQTKKTKKQNKLKKKLRKKADFEYYFSVHWKGWLYFLGSVVVVGLAVLSIYNIVVNKSVFTQTGLKNVRIFFFVSLGVFIVGLVLALIGFIGAYEDLGDSDGDQVSLVANGILNSLACIAGIVGMVMTFVSHYLEIGAFYVDETNCVVYASYDGNYEVYGLSEEVSDVVIFGEINHIKVNSIDSDYFQNKAFIRTLTFKNGTLTIPKEAFLNCVNLEEVHFDEYTYNIETNAFKGCTNLQKFNIGKAIVNAPKESLFNYNYKSSSGIFGGSTNATIIIDGGSFLNVTDSVGTYIIGNGSKVATSMLGKDEGKDVTVNNFVVVFTEGVNFDDTEFTVSIKPYLLAQFTSFPVGYTIYLPTSVTHIPSDFFGDSANFETITVCYAGTSEQWNNVIISSEGNSNINKLKLKYQSEFELN